MDNPVKISGREFKRFYNDPVFWAPEGETWHDDTLIRVNGSDLPEHEDPSAVPDDSVVEIVCGWVYGVPHKALSEKNMGAPVTEEMDLCDYFQLWHKHQTTVTMVVECGRSQVDAVIAAVLAAGGQVHR